MKTFRFKLFGWAIITDSWRTFHVIHTNKSGRIDFVKVFCIHFKFWEEGGKPCLSCRKYEMERDMVEVVREMLSMGNGYSSVEYDDFKMLYSIGDVSSKKEKEIKKILAMAASRIVNYKEEE